MSTKVPNPVDPAFLLHLTLILSFQFPPAVQIPDCSLDSKLPPSINAAQPPGS